MSDFIAQLDRRATQQLVGPLGAQLAGFAQGHKPLVAIVTCADARMLPLAIFGLQPNQALVVRTAGNQARPGSGEFASLLLGIRGCGINDVIVLGHSNCLAMNCVFDHECGKNHPELVEHLLGGDDQLRAEAERSLSVEALARENVRHQMQLISAAFIEHDLAHVQVHGRYLDLADSTLSIIDA